MVMRLADHLSEPGSARQLARALGVSDVMVSQWRSGIKTPAPAMCIQIESATGVQVRRWDLRPADWWLIWPESAREPGAPKIPKGASLPKVLAA